MAWAKKATSTVFLLEFRFCGSNAIPPKMKQKSRSGLGTPIAYKLYKGVETTCRDDRFLQKDATPGLQFISAGHGLQFHNSDKPWINCKLFRAVEFNIAGVLGVRLSRML
jgi:hypothetical protein